MLLNRLAILAQVQAQDQDQNGAMMLIIAVVELVLAIAMLAGLWKMFEKAGLPGWGAIIPIYNIYLMLKLAGRPGWWLLLYIIPCVNFIIAIVVYLDIAKNFGKGAGIAIGLIFLPFIFMPVLGFGDARYRAQKAYMG